MKNYLGIDLGTSSVKIGVIDEMKKIIFEDSREYPIFVNGLNSEQDPKDWWKAITEVLNEMPFEIKENVVSISFSGQMHGMVAVDNLGEPLHNAILWNDSRAYKEVNYFNKKFGQKKVSRLTGNLALEGFTAPKIMWLRANKKEIFDRVYKYLLPKDWLIYKFTGIFATDYSDAAGTLYFDVKNNIWSTEMLEELNIKENQLPELFRSTDIVGTINIDIANQFNLNKNIKIIAGGADNPVGAISQMIIDDGEALISLGTSGTVYIASDKYNVAPNNKLHSFTSCVGNYYQMGVTLSAGGALQWYIDNIIGKINFKKINKRLMTKLEQKSSLLFTPYISGERTPINDPLSTGSFMGIRREHDKYDFVKSIMEGVSFSIKSIFEIVENLGIKISSITMSGGGAKSEFWTILISTLLNRPVQILKNYSLGAFYGACLLSMIGAESLDIQKLKNTLTFETKTIEPLKGNTAKYLLEKYNIWMTVYPKTKEISHKLMSLI